MSDAVPIHFSERAIDALELGIIQFRRFLDVAPEEPIELVALAHTWGEPIWTAYPVGLEQTIAAMRAGEKLEGRSGVYVVPNRIAPALAAGHGRWQRSNRRARAEDIEVRRVVYFDLDAERPDKKYSATDAEKAPVYEVADRLEEWLTKSLGDPGAVGRGDSGNGLAIFVAIEPTTPTNETTARLGRLLGAVAKKFNTPHVTIDPKVFDPNRLCPAFGALKTKLSAPDRPSRRTYFSCRGTVRRVPLEALV